MARIKLDVEQMMTIASKYELQSDNIADLVVKLDQMLTELQMHWEGASATRFEQNYLELKPAILRMQQIILDTSKAIRHTANSISEVDSMVIG